MARLARVVAPGLPHHVTQRGNRRQPVFFSDDDYRTYLRLLKAQSARWGFEVWAYCLMTNHVHLIVVPQDESSLPRGIGETHRRYTRHINFREGWRGYLWQGRFGSVPLDERYLVAAVRYVERNPVEAGLVEHPEAYPWSSARAHVRRETDPVLTPCFLTEQIDDWRGFLASANPVDRARQLAQAMRTGRPCGDAGFVRRLETQLGRRLQRAKPGPKPVGVK